MDLKGTRLGAAEQFTPQYGGVSHGFSLKTIKEENTTTAKRDLAWLGFLETYFMRPHESKRGKRDAGAFV